MTRTRAEIERDIAAKRRERRLYVSPHGVAGIHAEIDRLLEEWEQAEPAKLFAELSGGATHPTEVD